MITAFQRNGFQDNAFQIGVTVGGGGNRWDGFLLAVRVRQMELRQAADSKRKREEEEALAQVAATMEHVTAQAAPIVTNLAALNPVEAAAPTVFIKAQERDDLAEFLAFMIKVAQSEEIA